MTFTQFGTDEPFTITLSDGTKLFALIRRHSMLAPRGLVVLVHGRLHRHDQGPCAELAATGRLPFDIVTFDLRGYGRSTGTTSYGNAEQEAEDLHQVILHLQKAGERILAIVGHSKGAVAMFMYAAHHPPPCRLLVNLSARYSAKGHDFRGRFNEEQLKSLADTGQLIWLHYRAGADGQERRPYIVTEEELGRYEKATLADYIPRIPKRCHFLNIHGRSDGTVRCWNGQQADVDLKAAGIASDFLLLDGVAHNYDAPGEIELLAALIRSWILSRGQMKQVDGERPLIDHLNKNAVARANVQVQS